MLKRRKLSDEELGSEDDDNPSQLDDDALDGSENEEVHERAQTILDVSIGRQAIPKPSDGEVGYWRSAMFWSRVVTDKPLS